MSVLTDAVGETSTSLKKVFSNQGLRRVQLAFGASLIGDWAYATAVVVWAYGVGGAKAVGAWGVVRLLLLATLTPFASVLADRYPRKWVMVGADLTRCVLVLAAAAFVYWHGPVLVVFTLATLASMASAPFRPAQAALLPSLVEEPEELTAANGTASTLESLAFFVGPAIGGLLLTVADVSTVFVLNAATFVVSALLVAGVRPIAANEKAVDEAEEADKAATAAAADGSTSSDGSSSSDGSTSSGRSGFFAESFAGFGMIWNHRDLRAITGLYCAQTIVAGASMVFGISVAVAYLGVGAKGVGYLDAVLGVGAILGGLLAIARASKGRLASDFGVGVIFWAIPLLLIAVWPVAGAAFLAMFVIGGANPIVDVNASTILQRLAPDEVMGRVFGALETGLISTMALGALIMPILISWLGLRWSLGILGVAMAAVVVPGLPYLRRLDGRLAPPEGFELLQSITLFAPLARPTMENLARRFSVVPVAAGDAVVREGEVGDRFYVIESGRVQVTQADRVLREETAGDFFGEIALLRDVPRTATVTALEDTVLRALDRDDFLGALTGSSEAWTAAEDIVSRRLPTT